MKNTDSKPLVTICVPHWQVKELVTICLRAIRKHTRSVPIEVIVVDNGSQDESLGYLRSLGWIRLIERGDQTPKNWVRAFTTALDLGFALSRSEYFIIMHTDTIVKHSGWLERMLAELQSDNQCAAVGAWKLERSRPFYNFIKKITDTKKPRLWLRRTLLNDPKARILKRELCPRDHCSLYRAEPIRRFGLTFSADGPWKGYTAGETMYYQLKDHDYRACVLDADEMMHYMAHLAHATAGLRPEQRHLRHQRAQKKSERRLRRFFNAPMIKALAEDGTLDE